MATWFSYDYCRDLPAMRRFWAELVGLPLIWDEPDSFAVEHDGVQLAYTQATETAPAPEDWAFQPGWVHGQLSDAPGTVQRRSMSIALPPDHFTAAVARLTAAGCEALRPEPFWVGYWSFVVRDPEGGTFELSDPLTPGPPEKCESPSDEGLYRSRLRESNP